MFARISGLVAAVVLAAAASVVTQPSPADAATCAPGHGVSVVVDFHELGGGVQSACIADGGGRHAADLFEAAGFHLEYVQQDPGFVCRVSGKPASSECVRTPPANAYWSLWWSDGKSGTWSYSTEGVSSLQIPDGGSVAFSWQGSTSKAPPGAKPPAQQQSQSSSPTQSPSSSPKPTHSSGSTAGGQPAAGARSSTPPPSASSTPGPASASSNQGTGASLSASTLHSKTPPPRTNSTRQHNTKAGKQHHRADKGSKTRSAKASDTGSADDSQSAKPAAALSSDPADPAGGGVPVWAGPLAIVLVFAAGGLAALARRRRAAGP